jgi:hypothetical protein
MENKDKIILEGKCTGNNDNGCFMESPGHDCGCFKRIQQEEPKQLTELEVAIKLEEIDREEYQQETLEEAAERIYPVNATGGAMEMLSRHQLNNSIKQEGFLACAKWQAKRMYSEEEVIKIVEKSRETGLTAEYLLLTEQFKKK